MVFQRVETTTGPQRCIVPSRECLTLKLFLSALYKSAALAGLATIVITLDVALSIAVIVGAFSLYYVSRAIVARVCPRHSQQEHREVVRSLRPSRAHSRAEQNSVGPAYTGNVTPLRRNMSREPETTTAAVPLRVRNR